ncbi:unnamed protein product [Arctia plantaginis]|uniref:Thioredoxin domain-containing protein 17 n=1 Tax=Arctia plantaginis TaxID=874455 RepID=A0A8S1A416_ARCPL|nr:unnamed protein product [Arctia plantaginis]CAB3239130.1 unnamed protein product [Arctia plantaginis]
MVTVVHLKGMDEFNNYVENMGHGNATLLFCFTGEKLSSGPSWCSDCNEAEPVIEAFLTEVKRKIIFAFVDVGDRDTWKDKNCPFRTDKRTKLMVIPTIIRWNGVQRLEGSQCGKRELLQMLIEDEED